MSMPGFNLVLTAEETYYLGVRNTPEWDVLGPFDAEGAADALTEVIGDGDTIFVTWYRDSTEFRTSIPLLVVPRGDNAGYDVPAIFKDAADLADLQDRTLGMSQVFEQMMKNSEARRVEDQ